MTFIKSIAFATTCLVLGVSINAVSYSEQMVMTNSDGMFSSGETVARGISKGDNLLAILRRHNFSKSEIQKVLGRKVLPKDFRLLPFSKYLVTTDALRTEINIFDHRQRVFMFWKEGTETGIASADPAFETKTIKVEGTLEQSIYSTIRRHVSDDWVASRFIDAYILDYPYKKIMKKGARFSLEVEENHVDGFFIGYGEVLRTSLEIEGKMVERHLVKVPGGGFFIPVNGWENRPFYSPVRYLHVSSEFSPKRFHPIRRRRVPHLGVDLSLPRGEDVFAAMDGDVIKFGKSKGAGNFVLLQHKDGFQTSYNHLSRIASQISLGVQVKAGEKLGEVGCTGYCTSSHLHFGVKQDSTSYNPVRLMKPFPIFYQATVDAFVKEGEIAGIPQKTNVTDDEDISTSVENEEEPGLD